MKHRWYVRGDAVLAISSFDGDWRFSTAGNVLCPQGAGDLVVASPHQQQEQGQTRCDMWTKEEGHWIWRIDAADGYMRAVGVFDHSTVDAFPPKGA